VIWIPSAFGTELREIPGSAISSKVDDARTGGWLIVRPTTEADLVKLLTVDLHQGEAEAIALAVETKSDWLLIDEREGREFARRLGLHMTGVLGVLLRAKRMGLIIEQYDHLTREDIQACLAYAKEIVHTERVYALKR
jgi:predicted nucleic acid-binding protein